MVPVSSTVIPLPVYKVGYGYGFVSTDKKGQDIYNPDGQVKLITGTNPIAIYQVAFISHSITGKLKSNYCYFLPAKTRIEKLWWKTTFSIGN